MAADITFQQSADKIFLTFGIPAVLDSDESGPLNVTVIDETVTDFVGEAGQTLDTRRRLSFLISQATPHVGELVTIGEEELTVDAIDADDGIVRSVWVR